MNITGGRFVITGGASLIGSHVADVLLSQGARELVLLDNFVLGSPHSVRHLHKDPRVKLVRGDVLRIGDLCDAFADSDGVFAIAGFLTLPLTQNPPLGLAVNVDGQVNMFEACRYRGVKKLVSCDRRGPTRAGSAFSRRIFMAKRRGRLGRIDGASRRGLALWRNGAETLSGLSFHPRRGGQSWRSDAVAVGAT